MSKSVQRVVAALQAADIDAEMRELTDCRTAEQAAAAVGCGIDQIAKSIIFWGADSDTALLFITAGGNMVDPDKAAACAREPLRRADANEVRAQTGFAIGGVSPIGHLNTVKCWMDPKLMDYPIIWAAGGTPRHVFAIKPADLHELSGAQLIDFT